MKLSKLLVVVHATQHLKWSLASDTTEIKSMCGHVVLFYSHLFVATYRLRTQTRLICTRKSLMEIIRYPSRHPMTLKTLFVRSCKLSQSFAIEFKTSGSIPGTLISNLIGFSAVSSSVFLRSLWTNRSLKNLFYWIKSVTTWSNALMQINITTLPQVTTCSWKKQRKLAKLTILNSKFSMIKKRVLNLLPPVTSAPNNLSKKA